ncbi:hypothetical protein EJ04DRAFT_571555 [Polyplosphaeria fusca]|uniref:Uncharacterized protein n=1 Tax=Polyplosphaeria fusca TaxID=682080 RepID=A0A9P4RDD1_9PLEO|nr:hypothetical protein EJ04DRAFT_571555 [Polyplosphaeria fusca]
MSAFSRGFDGFLRQNALRLPCPIRTALFSTRQPLHSRIDTQFFYSSALRRHTGSIRNIHAPKRYPSAGHLSNDPVLRTVDLTGISTVVYEAPRRTVYTIVTYAFACGLVGSGMYTLKWRYELPKDLPGFVGPTYVLIGFTMLIMAGWVFGAPVNRCRSITVIPDPLGMRGNLFFKIRARTLPFVWPKEKVFVARIGKVTISEKTNQLVRELKEAERARRQSISQGLEGMFITTRFWELLGRFIEQRWTSFFLRFKFLVLRFGVVQIEVEGLKWKVDCSGFMLEDGLAIDRLMPVVE